MRELDLKAYPSGFLGSRTAPQTKPVSDGGYMARLFELHDSDDERKTANAEVVRIFKQYGSNLSATDAEAFFDILGVASKAFGTLDLGEWCGAQTRSKYFTAQHADFIDETVNYLIYGQQRHIAFKTREMLLGAGINHANVSTLRKSTRETLELYQGQSITTLWLSKHNGYADLINTLFLMYGMV